jgi:hypothetical protein
MKKIIYLILLTNAFVLNSKAQTTAENGNQTYIYRNYTKSIVRVPYPSYLVKGQYIYRLYPKSIVRVPYPEFTIKGDNIYRNYSDSIIRTPYPIGKIGSGIPE